MNDERQPIIQIGIYARRQGATSTQDIVSEPDTLILMNSKGVAYGYLRYEDDWLSARIPCAPYAKPEIIINMWSNMLHSREIDPVNESRIRRDDAFSNAMKNPTFRQGIACTMQSLIDQGSMHRVDDAVVTSYPVTKDVTRKLEAEIAGDDNASENVMMVSEFSDDVMTMFEKTETRSTKRRDQSMASKEKSDTKNRPDNKTCHVVVKEDLGLIEPIIAFSDVDRARDLADSLGIIDPNANIDIREIPFKN